MPSAMRPIADKGDLIDFNDRASISSSESIYNGSAEERFVILRRLRSDIYSALAKFRHQFETVKQFSDKDIEDCDEKFDLAVFADGGRRAVIQAAILWVNECHELLDPKADAVILESSALVLRRVAKTLKKLPRRLPEDPVIIKKIMMPTVNDMLAPL